MDHAGLIDAKMELPPATPAAATVFRGSPLTGPDDGQTRAVEHEMEALAGRDQSQTARQMLTAPGERRIVGGGEVEVHHPEQGVQESFGLAQREMVEEPQGQGGLDGEIRVPPLPTPPAAPAGRPGSDRFRGHPHRHIAASNEGLIVGRPVRHPILRLIPGMNLRLHPRSVVPAGGPEKCGPRRPTRSGYSCNNASAGWGRAIINGCHAYHSTSLPPDARLWIFASGRPLSQTERARVLDEVDAFIGQWAAHDMPLTTARDLRYDQFIFVAVDERAAGASGCSIDALVRRIKALQAELGGRAGEPGAGTVSRRIRHRASLARAVRRPRRIRVGQPGDRRLRQHADQRRRRSRGPLGAARGRVVARPGVLLDLHGAPPQTPARRLRGPQRPAPLLAGAHVRGGSPPSSHPGRSTRRPSSSTTR